MTCAALLGGRPSSIIVSELWVRRFKPNPRLRAKAVDLSVMVFMQGGKVCRSPLRRRSGRVVSRIPLMFDPALRDAAEASKAWPFEEARKLIARVERTGQTEVLFETGYGPSGLPHIGTFGEVARTTMVRHAFRVLTDDKIKTRLSPSPTTWTACARSPDNIPNREMVLRQSRQAADRGSRSLRRIRELRRAQQRDAAPLPRRLRLRLRIRLLDRILPLRPLRRGAAAHAAPLRRGAGDHAAELARGARRDLFAVPARSIPSPASSCRFR